MQDQHRLNTYLQSIPQPPVTPTTPTTPLSTTVVAEALDAERTNESNSVIVEDTVSSISSAFLHTLDAVINVLPTSHYNTHVPMDITPSEAIFSTPDAHRSLTAESISTLGRQHRVRFVVDGGRYPQIKLDELKNI